MGDSQRVGWHWGGSGDRRGFGLLWAARRERGTSKETDTAVAAPQGGEVPARGKGATAKCGSGFDGGPRQPGLEDSWVLGERLGLGDNSGLALGFLKDGNRLGSAFTSRRPPPASRVPSWLLR